MTSFGPSTATERLRFLGIGGTASLPARPAAKSKHRCGNDQIDRSARWSEDGIDCFEGGSGDAIDHRAKVPLPGDNLVKTHLHKAVVPGSTSAGAAPRRSSKSCSPAGVGKTSLPTAANRFCRFNPLMISARVAGVPMPLASLSRSRRAGSSTKRHAFCMASTNVPSSYKRQLAGLYLARITALSGA